MDTDVLGLPADVMTAATVVVTGVLVPAVTAVLKYPGTPKWLKRGLPIGLSALGALLIVLFKAGGEFAEQATTWILLLAALVGIAQVLYSVMPGAWLKLEGATSPRDRTSGERSAYPDANTHRAGTAPTEEILGRETGAQSIEGEQGVPESGLEDPGDGKLS